MLSIGSTPVEKYTGCIEAFNRCAYDVTHPGKSGRVDMWADSCQ